MKITTVVSFAVAVLFAGLCIADQQNQEEKPFEEDPQTDHGHIRWISTAKRLPDGWWRYERWVENLDSRRARVSWEPLHWGPNWLEPKQKLKASSIDWKSDPTLIYGAIRFFGGVRPGESVSDTSIWSPLRLPAEQKIASIRSSAEIAFQYKEKIYPFSISAESRLTQDEAPFKTEYSFAVKSAADVRLPSEIKVRWDSIVSDEYLAMKETEFLKLNESGGAEFTLNSQTRPTLRFQTVRFQNADGFTLTQAELPAFAPPPPSKRR